MLKSRLVKKDIDRLAVVSPPRSRLLTGDYDDYRVESADGTLEILSDLQLSPAVSGTTIPDERPA
jgi:hypothetical protein